MHILKVLALALCLMQTAQAQNKESAREAYRRGVQDYNLGEYQSALDAFKSAYRNFEDPRLLFNIGQCQRMLGQHVEALRSFRAYLRESSETPNRTEVERLMASLEETIRKQEARVVPLTPSPEPMVAVAPAASPAPQVAAPAAPDAPEKTPVYKKWWLWTAVVAVVAAGVGVGLGVGLTRTPADRFPTASTSPSDGTFHF